MASKNRKPIRSMVYIIFCSGSGATAYSKREPSRGGIGSMLKINNRQFNITNITKNVPSKPTGWATRNISPARIAINKLLSGPDMPMRAAPNSSYFTRAGLNGTGLAANIGGKPTAINITGNKIVVYRSICASGLSVRRPRSLAVVSPSQCDVKACVAS